jgi:hypothetical protein
MKNSTRILMCALFLFVAGMVGATIAPDPVQVLTHAQLANTAPVMFMAAPVILSGSITQAQIDDLKIKYGKIKIITVVAEEAEKDATGKELVPAETYQFLVRRPDRGLIKMLLPLAESRQLDEFADKAVKNLVVGGDTDKLDDGIVFMGVVSQLKKMISPAQSFLSNA